MLLPQVDVEPAAAARVWREQHERAIVDEFVELLSIPNVSRDRKNIVRNAEWIVKAFGKRGVKMQLLRVRGASPAVFGEIKREGATRTLIFYAHYDGQPVDASRWTHDPFEPVLYDRSIADGGKRIPLPEPGARFDPESRLYARSAGDDKAPIIEILAALDALRAAKITPRANLKFFFEGEEEMGSINLRRILRKHKSLLQADAWVFCDGPVHQNRQQQVVFGVRGVTGMEITLYGARRPLHSGHYGNWAPNPAMMLAKLIGSMKGDDDRVLVKGFYDEVAPLTEVERKALAVAPRFDDELKSELWLKWTEGGGHRLDMLINMPSLNVRGLRSATVGVLGRNIVPSTATASIDIRLVKGMDPRKTTDRVLRHIREQGYHVVETKPGADVRKKNARVAWVSRRRGYAALRTPMDLPIAKRIVRAVESARGDVVKLPTLGGSLPLSMFDEELHTPVVIVPIANHDNNQHAQNENLRIRNLWDGIETMAALLAMDDD